MGLTATTRARLGTGAMLVAALLLDVLAPRPDEARAFATRRLGAAAERVDLPLGPAYHAGDRGVLFFTVQGAQAPIRGAVLVAGASIEDLLLFDAQEGIDRRALRSPAFRASFRGRPIGGPVVVDSVSGATISSQAVIDAVNQQLLAWRRRVEVQP